MASTVLPNGIIIPEKFSRDWYADLYHNWQELDNLLGGGTPKDGTLTIQKNGTTVGTFSANQATNETINITVPDVNDATLTIQKNGTTVDTFTANSSSDKTVNISVPTKTSDLNNDSGFITGVAWDDVTNKPSFATVATSGSYTDLSNKPTIPTVNNATLTIQKNGTTVQTFTANQSTNATANITVPTKTSDLTNDSGFITSDNTKIPLAGSNQISGSLIPSTDGTVNLGGSSYQWNNLYAKNYYYKGVAWGLDKQNEWTNFQRMISNPAVWYLRNNTVTLGTTPSSNRYIGMFFEDVNGADLGYAAFQANKNGYNSIMFNLHNSDGTNAYTGTLRYRASTTGDYCFFPETSECDLGTSTNKWKSFNGTNPGALSLPSGTVSMNLIGDVSVVGTEKKLSKDITVTGYIYVDVSFTSSNRLNLYNDTKKYGIWIPCDSGRIRQIMPISANDRLEFNVLDDGSTVNAVQLFACQGNV